MKRSAVPAKAGGEPSGVRCVRRGLSWGWSAGEGGVVGEGDGVGVVGEEFGVASVAVDEVVVIGAEQNQVVEICVAAVEPGVDVVGVASPGGGGAVPGATAAVADGEGASLVGGDESSAAPDVEDH